MRRCAKKAIKAVCALMAVRFLGINAFQTRTHFVVSPVLGFVPIGDWPAISSRMSVSA